MSREREWVRLPVTPALRAAAMARRRELDIEAHGRTGLMPEAGGVAARANGHLAELVLADVLEAVGLRVERNGGIDGRPDLNVEEIRLGVKYRNTNHRSRPDYSVIVFDRHLEHGDSWAFVAPDPPASDHLLLLGFATAELVRSGRPFDIGAELARGFLAVAPGRELLIAELEAPAAWLERTLRKKRTLYVLKSGTTSARQNTHTR